MARNRVDLPVPLSPWMSTRSPGRITASARRTRSRPSGRGDAQALEGHHFGPIRRRPFLDRDGAPAAEARGGVEAVLQLDHALHMADPVGDLGVVGHEPGERLGHLGEGRAHLHEDAEADGAGEVAWRGDEDGEDVGDHPIGRGEAHEVPLDAVQPQHHAGDAAEAAAERPLLVGLAADQGHALAVLPEADQGEAVVALGIVPAVVDGGHRPADRPGRRGAQGGVDHRGKHHVAGDFHLMAGQDHGQRAGDGPEDADEGDQQQDRMQQAERQLHRVRRRPAGVLADALVRVVGGAFEVLEAVVAGFGQKAALQAPDLPFPPPDLQGLPRMELQHGGDDAGDREGGEEPHLPQELGVVALFEGVEEVAVAEVELHLDRDLDQGQDHHGGGDRPGGAPLFGPVIGARRGATACG